MLRVSLLKFSIPRNSQAPHFMAQTVGNNTEKKLIRIDVTSDPVCPWCFVAKRNLDKAMASTMDLYDFEIRWHPFFLDRSAPTEGISKREYYTRKFMKQTDHMFARMEGVFRDLGMHYDTSGLTGNTMDSHRLIYFAGQQGHDKQHNLMEELFIGYFTQGKFIGDREFLLECAKKAGVEEAAEFLDDPSNGLKEVNEEVENAKDITSVPYLMINGQLKISGGQPPHVFLSAFQRAASD